MASERLTCSVSVAMKVTPLVAIGSPRLARLIVAVFEGPERSRLRHRYIYMATSGDFLTATDSSLPVLDPRRYPLKVKDLRAFAASVLLDSGSSLTAAALLLRRHSDKKGPSATTPEPCRIAPMTELVGTCRSTRERAWVNGSTRSGSPG